uniref:Uncharacterized protein n=1 Tax=Salix viminalis TaxID=40686 RepID=A0A6N2MVE7_SALVM
MISLDANSEFIFRNLVAYELSHASGPCFLLVDERDYRHRGRCEIAERERHCFQPFEERSRGGNLWNGMSKCKSIRLTKARSG